MEEPVALGNCVVENEVALVDERLTDRFQRGLVDEFSLVDLEESNPLISFQAVIIISHGLFFFSIPILFTSQTPQFTISRRPIRASSD